MFGIINKKTFSNFKNRKLFSKNKQKCLALLSDNSF